MSFAKPSFVFFLSGHNLKNCVNDPTEELLPGIVLGEVGGMSFFFTKKHMCVYFLRFATPPVETFTLQKIQVGELLSTSAR